MIRPTLRSSEERFGLLFILVGGALLLVVVLWLTGFFREPAPRERTGDRHAEAAAPRRRGAVAADVVDAQSGHALAGVEFEVVDLDGVSDHWLAPPDPARPRRLELQGLPAERDFTLEVRAPDHVPQRRTLRVAAGNTTELGEVRLVPLLVLQGTLVDGNDQPLAAAEVVATCESDPKEQRTATASALGAFRIEGLTPARWQLVAAAATGEHTAVATAVDGTGGGESAPLRLELFPTVTVRGRLRLDVGARAPVRVRCQGRTAPVAPDGSFTLPGLFAGRAELAFDAGTAEAPSWSALPVDLPQEPLVLDPAQLRPSPRGDDAPVFVPPPAGAAGPCNCIVRVLDEEGRPLAGARVELALDDATRVARATARNGETTFRGLRAGPVRELAARFGRLHTFEAPALELSERTGARAIEVRCVLPRRVAVRLLAPDGSPVADLRVGIRVATRTATDERGGFVDATTNRDGTATLDDLPPPPWRLHIPASPRFDELVDDAANGDRADVGAATNADFAVTVTRTLRPRSGGP